MANPYTCEAQLDELVPGDTVKDFAYISEENFVLVVLLTSQGVEECLVAPTCMQCFVTRNPPRPLLVLSNKAGAVLLVDLSTRKCIAELSAPQSIREVEVVQTSDTTDILLTSFTDAQWIIPLENGGRCLTEVLTTCIPSEFKKTEPSSSHLRLCAEGITVLDSVGCFVELHNGLSAVGAVPKKRYKVDDPEVKLLRRSSESILMLKSSTITL
ncbi:hypothetical protein NECAME_14098 [Necator americanus]|uniref:Uncharacterized protein n=1 Tax=Necator americanus TaxID=51031 RepID=W2SSX4_NECAM|nr:hypothetical protein NECAME_14098 [Necator americanus]ETN71767.1 hypothetical protein NECAME_14098 [Necator americanus]